jgi:hypothetical protein
MASTEELDAIFAQYRASSTEEKARWRAALLAHYRATTWFKRARKIISPKAERAAECEVAIANALWSVRGAAEVDKSNPSRAKDRKLFEKLAKTLRTAVDITNQLGYGGGPWSAARKRRPVRLSRGFSPLPYSETDRLSQSLGNAVNFSDVRQF